MVFLHTVMVDDTAAIKRSLQTICQTAPVIRLPLRDLRGFA